MAIHQIYQEKGEAYLLGLMVTLREKWGYRKGDASLRLRLDEIKKRYVKEVKGNG